MTTDVQRARILARLDAEDARKRDRLRRGATRTMRDLVPELVMAPLAAAGVISLDPERPLLGHDDDDKEQAA